MPAIIKGLNHITLDVRDLEKSIGFYRDLLGFIVRAHWPKGAYLEADDLWLCLNLSHQPPTSPLNQSYSHIALSAADADFDVLATSIREQCVIWQENKSEGQSIYFLDPDGHKLEIHIGTLETRLDHYRRNNISNVTILD